MVAERDGWLAVDRKGLAALLERKGPGWVLFELIQNALDEATTRVEVFLDHGARGGRYYLQVADDSPNGWVDLAHAFTMFAPSAKKGDPEKRGRFNLGEKLVLAVADSATVRTMNGMVTFHEDGRRTIAHHVKRDRGTVFEATLRWPKAKAAEALAEVRRVLVPDGVALVVNGEEIPHRRPVASFWEVLPTEVEDEAGVLRRTNRKALVEVFEPLPGEVAGLFEAGVPVVDTRDRWSVNVHQKVPLNMERENVTPSYLRRVRAAVLNALHNELAEEDAAAPWVQEAAGSPEVDALAFESVLDRVHGERRVMRDPSDHEANSTAFGRGYAVVSGNQLSQGMRDNLRRFREEGHEPLAPAGRVFPTPKPYAEDGDPVKEVEPDEWMARVKVYAEGLGRKLLGRSVRVRFVLAPNFRAAYGQGCLDFSVQGLGRAFFRVACEREHGLASLDALIVHEFAHEFEGNHLAPGFHHAQAKLAGDLAREARWDPKGLRP